MKTVKRIRKSGGVAFQGKGYADVLRGVVGWLEAARHASAHAANAVMTATYWEIGRRIVEFEQGGKARAEYGERLLVQLAEDLTARHGRGFSRQGLQKMRSFYLEWEICPTPSGKFEAHAKCPTLSGKSEVGKRQTPSPDSVQAMMPVTAPAKQHSRRWEPSRFRGPSTSG